MIRFFLIAGLFTVVDIIDIIKRKERAELAIYIIFMTTVIVMGVIYGIR